MFALRPFSRAAAPLSASRAFSTSTPRSLARMNLIGRLADQPEITPTSTGRDIIRYAMGVSHGRSDESGNRAVSWYKVASFQTEGPQRDLLLNLPKGTLIYVEADARMDSYEAQDGTKRTSLRLVQRQFEILNRPKQESSGTTGAESDAEAAEEPESGLGAS